MYFTTKSYEIKRKCAINFGHAFCTILHNQDCFFVFRMEFILLLFLLSPWHSATSSYLVNLSEDFFFLHWFMFQETTYHIIMWYTEHHNKAQRNIKTGYASKVTNRIPLTGSVIQWGVTEPLLPWDKCFHCLLHWIRISVTCFQELPSLCSMAGRRFNSEK